MVERKGQGRSESGSECKPTAFRCLDQLVFSVDANSISAAKTLKTKAPITIVVSISAPARMPQADTTAVRLRDHCHQTFQVASQAVQLPVDEGVARLQGFQTGPQAGVVITPSQGAALADTLFADAEQGATLCTVTRGLT